MELVLRPLASAGPGEADVEIVERKGLGHPDTICDYLAEGLSAALCRRHLREFGTVLELTVACAFVGGFLEDLGLSGGEGGDAGGRPGHRRRGRDLLTWLPRSNNAR